MSIYSLSSGNHKSLSPPKKTQKTPEKTKTKKQNKTKQNTEWPLVGKISDQRCVGDQNRHFALDTIQNQFYMHLTKITLPQHLPFHTGNNITYKKSAYRLHTWMKT